MESKILTATGAYTLFLENVASVLDCRDKGIESGVLAPDMDDLEAINWLNSLTLWNNGYDRDYSPSIFYAFLYEYCQIEYSEGLLHFYPQLAARDSIILRDGVWNFNMEIWINIYDYAQRSEELGAKKHWGIAFKSNYQQEWLNAFEDKENKKPKKKGFFNSWFGK
ncbi:Putative uncharacterized protein [Moritella viscosa]|uniref:hypothetical protein n=1 Tax=Moritella viscosa TaxID=80854 RepID=UPI00091350BA|nr:hypothetical protein [Moritella viscosa]SGZ09694.1 Putative uncharacterized protein [Moritella viscosa]